MTSGVRGDEFDNLLSRARQAVADVSGTLTADTASAEPVVGEAADGMVRVTMAPAGELSEIKVDPKLLRDGIDEVCENIVVATNDAIRKMRAASRTPGSVDPAALAGTLRELQQDSLREMASFGSALNDVVAQLRGRS